MPDSTTVFKYDNDRPLPGVAFKFKATEVNDPFMVNLKVQVTEDGKVIPDESDLVNLDELIQTYKDQCGMDMALRMIKLGQIDPRALRDDCQHSGDLSNVPDTPQGIANAAIAAKGDVEALRAKYGIKGDNLPDEVIDVLIRDYINANLDKFVKSAVEVKPTEGGDK